MDEKNYVKSMKIRFNLSNGLSPDRESKKRMLSDMDGMYLDNKTLKKIVNKQDILVYEFYEIGLPEEPEHIAFGTTILYPGKVGNEYFMTKGHFHSIQETAEVYYCIKGHGYLLMEDLEGNVEIQEMEPGVSVYVPPNYAHRSINISDDEPLVSFFAFRADAGHDYKTIETKGFKKLVIEKSGKPEIIDNPRWKIKLKQ
ncbi:MAG: glucose-6-phosphate isomerase family protein [Candidatus Hodarchaeota archaeon]